MESKQFSVGEALKQGWRTMRGHLVFFIFLILVVFGISSIPGVLKYWAVHSGQADWVFGLVLLLQLIVGLTLSLGAMRVALSFVDKEKPSITQLFTVLPKVFTYFVSSLVYSIVVFVGTLLLVVPGVIWGLRYYLFPYFILDKGAGPIEALRMSAEATKGAKWDLFAFALVSPIIALLGFFCLVVGLFAALPTLMVAQAFIYRHLAGSNKH